MRAAAFRYGQHMVFEDLNLDVLRGEVLTVLGPNGCGKSTLLRCIGGALPLSHGTVRFEGIELSALGVTERARKIGFLFQRHSPSFPFAVLDVVIMGRTPYLAALGATDGAGPGDRRGRARSGGHAASEQPPLYGAQRR